MRLRATSSHVRIPFYNQYVAVEGGVHNDGVTEAATGQLLRCVQWLKRCRGSDKQEGGHPFPSLQGAAAPDSCSRTGDVTAGNIWRGGGLYGVARSDGSSATDGMPAQQPWLPPSLPLPTLLPLYQALSTLLSPSMVHQTTLDFEAGPPTNTPPVSPDPLHNPSTNVYEPLPPPSSAHMPAPLSPTDFASGEPTPPQLSTQTHQLPDSVHAATHAPSVPSRVLYTLVAASDQMCSRLLDTLYEGKPILPQGTQGDARDAFMPNRSIHRYIIVFLLLPNSVFSRYINCACLLAGPHP